MERNRGITDDRASATVENAGLILLVALALTAAVVVAGSGLGTDSGRGIGVRIANRIACGPVGPGPCRSHPLVEAYGEDLAKAIRALGPPPAILLDPAGRRLLPVDFRYCRRASCAELDPGDPLLRLTASNRRTTWFTEVTESANGHLVTWWGFWPGIGWRAIRRAITRTDAGDRPGVRLNLSDGPRLVPLEALDGRNHRDFTGIEVPPWQWKVRSGHESRNP